MNQKHFELHVVLTPGDSTLYEAAGLPGSREISDCANCGATVGDDSGKFKPYALVLDADHHHTLCLSCAAPVTRPRS